MCQPKNVYLSEYFLECFGSINNFNTSRVCAALQRTESEIQKRLSVAEIPIKELNDLWDVLNSFEDTLKEYKSDFPTLYSIFKENNFTYKRIE